MQPERPLESLPSAENAAHLRGTLARAAWWSILLGLLMEALLLLIRLDMPRIQAIGEALGKITWSVIVCLGLGIGKVLSEDQPFWMGLAGLMGAPLAFTAAQAVQKTVTELTTSVASGPMSRTVIELGAVRGAEYLCLGAALAIIAGRRGRFHHHLAAGLIAGIVFGVIILALTPATTKSVVGLLSWGVNELIFPMGCAAVLYGTGAVKKVMPEAVRAGSAAKAEKPRE